MALRVCVIGAGLAGLACALAAAQAGAAVDICETRRLEDCPAAHVEVVPNMLRELAGLGVAEECVRAGFPYRQSTVLSREGNVLFSLPVERLAGERYPGAIGIGHLELQRVLVSALSDSDVRVRAGQTVRDVLVESSAVARVQFQDGSTIAADLVVLACGSQSALSERVFGRPNLAWLGADWTYALLPRPREFEDAVLAASPRGFKAHLVPIAGARVGVRISPSASAPALATRQDFVAALASFAAPIGGLARFVPPQLPLPSRTAMAGIVSGNHIDGPILAVGDCAHVFAPHFGQSAAQAVEDAVVLGDLLRAAAGPAELPLAFHQRRMPRIQRIHAITTQAARWDAEPARNTDLLTLAQELRSVVAQTP